MSNTLRELFIKIGLTGAKAAIKEQDQLAAATDKVAASAEKQTSARRRQATGIKQFASEAAKLKMATQDAAKKAQDSMLRDEARLSKGLERANKQAARENQKRQREDDKRRRDEQKAAGERLDNIKSFAKDIGSTLIGVLGANVITGAFNQFRSLTQSFVHKMTEAVFLSGDLEQAQKRLRTAMTLSGQGSDEASKKMDSFVSSLSSTTGMSRIAAYEMLSLAKAFNLTNEQARDTVEVATDFSSATGKSMEESVRTIGRTFGGFSGELGEINVGVRRLSELALRSGGALRVLRGQFGGSAAKNINTFNGAWQQLKTTMEEGLIVAGRPLMESLIPFLKQLSGSIKIIMPDIRAFGEMMRQTFFVLVDSFKRVFNFNQGTAGGYLKGFGRFLLNIALLLEDFVFFIKGERSFLGKKFGVNSLGDLIGVGIGKAIKTVLGEIMKAIPEFIPTLAIFFSDVMALAIKELFGIDLRKLFGKEGFLRPGEVGPMTREQAQDKGLLTPQEAMGTQLGKLSEEGPMVFKVLELLLKASNFISGPSQPPDMKLEGGYTGRTASTKPDSEKSSMPDTLSAFASYALGQGNQAMAFNPPGAMGGGYMGGPSNTSNTDARTVNVNNDIKINTQMPVQTLQKQIEMAVFNSFSQVIA